MAIIFFINMSIYVTHWLRGKVFTVWIYFLAMIINFMIVAQNNLSREGVVLRVHSGHQLLLSRKSQAISALLQRAVASGFWVISLNFEKTDLCLSPDESEKGLA